MKRFAVMQRTMDTGRRVFNAAWLSASCGLSILQMLLLAQGWRASQQALVAACLASMWMPGALLGARLSGSARLWGGACLACVLLWLGCPALIAWHIPWPLVPPGQPGIVALALFAVLLGMSSTAWLAQQRAWPPAGERTILGRNLVGLTIGLLVAWLLPDTGALIALACCLPLLVLDAFLCGRAPLPPPGGLAARWIDRYWSAAGWPVPLERRGLLSSWRELAQNDRSELARGKLPLTLLASVVSVVLASVWGAIPTPFAASLHATHNLDVLYWLLGGQIIALFVGTGCLFAARGVIGFPDRVLPRQWYPRLRWLALLMPLGMAVSLAALGVPMLQARGWLALSLGGYTLADAVWSILLPRLLPDVATQIQSQRHLLFWQRAELADPLHLAHARACEARTKLLLARAEGLAIAVCTPLLGWLIDRLGSVDAALVLVGMVFALGLLCAALAWALVTFTRRFAHRRPALARQRPRFSGSSFPRLGAAELLITRKDLTL